ncbi:MAG TPA: gliding motility-associated C-terminal domain-containing protein, partial [Bacteroidales bacterium]|nr:gliding motility-associated C-terminal domain-containing protein [Bacteroidales bacterium]
ISPEPVEISFISQSVLCHGESNGSLIADPQGGTAPYNYIWEDTHTGDTLSGLSSGSYRVTISDVNNCTATQAGFVPEPSKLNANVLAQDIRCYGNQDGKAIAEAFGGTEPYDYEWHFNGLTSHNNEINNLQEGFYELMIEDKHGCMHDTSVMITQPAPIIVDYEMESPTCIGNDDGEIVFSVAGGVEPYRYESSIATQNLPDFFGLYEGNYEFTITDANGCEEEMNTIVLADNPVECIQIPDAFTPNGDNNNDTWIIENIEMFPNHVVQVFNRWGQVVYFKKYGDEPWDGTLKGKKLPTGSYVYVVDLHNQMEAKTGTVTIIY